MTIHIYDHLPPEDNAMLQALYSRSAESVGTHMQKVGETGSGKFMERYYVNYGHNSIADCGTTTIFFEGVSMLAAKAIQDWPLYSGQETSTRAVDFANIPEGSAVGNFVNPAQSHAAYVLQRDLLDFYLASQDEVSEHVRSTYPKMPDEDQKAYDGAVKARTFDILRGFLPAGLTTQLSWHTNLRQCNDHLTLMEHHPLQEVRDLAAELRAQLSERYPNSSKRSASDEQLAYRRFTAQSATYFDVMPCPEEVMWSFNGNKDDLMGWEDVFNKRPAKERLPEFLTDLGLFRFMFPLDFGSFRDIQRHRHGVCRMPILTTRIGFNQWYLDQLPAALHQRAVALLARHTQRLDELYLRDSVKQYYIPMGYNVACQVAYGLPALVYLVELRSGKTVHPTLRKVAHDMIYAIEEELPFVKLHVDKDPDGWTVRRGRQMKIEERIVPPDMR